MVCKIIWGAQIPWGGGLKRKIILHEGVFDQIISLDNLFKAWREFRKGKRSKPDVMTFEYTLEDNIFQLHQDLSSGSYWHGSYQQFQITDPKARVISKSSVRDRLLHHAIYRILYPTLDETFIYDSYSCRNNKGTHKAFARLQEVVRKISHNYTKPCFALKLDIRKFFDSVDHEILMDLLRERIEDKKLLELLENIIRSFSSIRHAEFISASPVEILNNIRSFDFAQDDKARKSLSVQDDAESRGIPLGNLTSQLFANVYLDPLDKFAKHKLKAKYYLRYADDFIFLSDDPDILMGYLVEVNQFLKTNLKLNIHPNKIYFRKLRWGIDYVGYVVLPHYSIPRKKTVKRIFKKVSSLFKESDLGKLAQALPSYLGYLQHVRSHKIRVNLLELVGSAAGKIQV